MIIHFVFDSFPRYMMSVVTLLRLNSQYLYIYLILFNEMKFKSFIKTIFSYNRVSVCMTCTYSFLHNYYQHIVEVDEFVTFSQRLQAREQENASFIKMEVSVGNITFTYPPTCRTGIGTQLACQCRSPMMGDIYTFNFHSEDLRVGSSE